MPVTWVPCGSQASGWSAPGTQRPPVQVTPRATRPPKSGWVTSTQVSRTATVTPRP